MAKISQSEFFIVGLILHVGWDKFLQLFFNHRNGFNHFKKHAVLSVENITLQSLSYKPCCIKSALSRPKEIR